MGDEIAEVKLHPGEEIPLQATFEDVLASTEVVVSAVASAYDSSGASIPALLSGAPIIATPRVQQRVMMGAGVLLRENYLVVLTATTDVGLDYVQRFRVITEPVVEAAPELLTSGPDGNSYVTLEEADAYFATRLHAEAWEAATRRARAQALIMAAGDLSGVRWKGEKADPDFDAEVAVPFPRVADAVWGAETANRTSHTIGLPATTRPGDLLLAFVAFDGNPTVTWPAGWTAVLAESDGNVWLEIATRVADGSEGAAIVVGTGSPEQSVHRTARIVGATDVEVLAVTGSDAVPDAPVLDPSWGVERALWYAVVAYDGADPIVAFPLNYTATFGDVSGGGQGVGLGTCRRALAVESEDPGAYTLTVATGWIAATVAVRSDPAAVPSTIRYAQALAWPRTHQTDGAGNYATPAEIRDAQCEQALWLLAAGSSANRRRRLQAQGVQSFSVEGMTESYRAGAGAGGFRAWDRLCPEAQLLVARHVDWSVQVTRR